MRTDLAGFLAAGTRLCEEKALWSNGTLPLDITYYLGDRLPTANYVSSVRAIVFQGHNVLVITDHQGGKYILPGGRVEKGEAPA